jgi:hypothetical protein
MLLQEATAIIKAIVCDIKQRKGLGDEWDDIDPTIQFEIQHEWFELIRRIVNVE